MAVAGLLFALLAFVPIRYIPTGLKWLQEILLIAVSVSLIGFILEIFFSGLCRSNNVGYTLAAENWEEKYWHQNSLGYRDIEFSAKDTTRKKIVFIGDSFTAGEGIALTSDRYADIAVSEMADSFTAYNLAIPGINTFDKLKQLQQFHLRPDVIVYQYFMDDILDAATFCNLPTADITPPYSHLPVTAVWFIEKSYLINYLYWSFPHFEFAGFVKSLKTAAENPKVISMECAKLDSIIDYAATNKCTLRFVIIPNTFNFNISKPVLDKITAHLALQKVKYVDATELISNFEAKDRIVNSNDYHLNERMNGIMAKALVKSLAEPDSLIKNELQKVSER